MRTKQKGSRTHNTTRKKLIKVMKNKHRMRLNRTREYSIQLMKVFKNRLINFIV
jgi:ribosomal protein L18